MKRIPPFFAIAVDYSPLTRENHKEWWIISLSSVSPLSVHSDVAMRAGQTMAPVGLGLLAQYGCDIALLRSNPEGITCCD